MFQRIEVRGEVLNDFDRSSSLEWIEVNGLGGYASSTLSGANTRRYHGLLVASLNPPLERRLLLAKLEEKVIVGGEVYELGCNRYPGVIYPSGHKFLKLFALNPFPRYLYSVGGALIEKEIFAVHGFNRTVVTYRLISSPGEVTLEVRPMIAGRDFHHLMRENLRFNAYIRSVPGGIMMMPYDEGSKVYIVSRGSWFRRSGCWYRNFEYHQEMLRGLDFREDLFSPGYFTATLNQGDELFIIASTDYPEQFDPEEARSKELERRGKLLGEEKLFESIDQIDPTLVESLLRPLLLAADTFLVRRSDGSIGLIAGYHWFSEWGRDAMIALPGLTLATGRFDLAADLIRSYVKFMERGLIPNSFLEDGRPIYNSADATLWLFNAVYLYYKLTGDLGLVSEVYPRLKESVEWHIRGTRFNIHVDPDDQLLVQGEPGVQLTWMDAKVGDWVVTPRHGKAVEINALWYNALKVMAELAKALKKRWDRRKFKMMAKRAGRSFMRRFWNREMNCLYDCINGDRGGTSIRPNQVIALALPFTPVPVEVGKAVLDLVERELLTPYGLRSLSPSDPSYKGRYQGDQMERDGAYHQGTVWAWLMGQFISAYIRYHRGEPDLREKVLGFLKGFQNHIREAGVGTISEIFDGDPPHHPRGCISQAWSVSEILRVLIWDLPRCVETGGRN